MRKTILTTTAALSLALAGCSGPDGRVDMARTALLGAGLGAAVFSVGGLIEDGTRPSYGRHGYGYGYSGGYRRPAYRNPYSYGYGGGW